MYLELGVDASHIHAQYPMDTTHAHQKKSFQTTRLRGFHPLRQNIPVKFQLQSERTYSGQHHISPSSHKGIQFVLHRFRSPLLTVSQILLSLPPPTKMFQFGRFPLPKEHSIPERME